MNFKNRTFYRILLFLIILICILLISFQGLDNITGNSLLNITSNVSLLYFYSISFSNNLSSGISFGTIESLPSVNTNATANYLASNNGTEYFINVSGDGNTDVDFCIKADGDLESVSNDILALANESYSNSNSTNSSLPSTTEISLTTSYVKSGEDISSNEINYYRFWLDVPVGQPAGIYNNTINFKAVPADYPC